MSASTLHPTAWQTTASEVHARSCLEEAARMAPAFEGADPWLHQLAKSLTVEVGTLAEFGALMAQQGFRPQMSRFFLDLVYAYRQLAIAHSVGNPRLKTLALELFEACQCLDQRRRQLSEPSLAH